MNLPERFRAAWIFESAWDHVELLPTVLARAAAQVLAVDAAGISFMGGAHRVPLAASSAEAAVAERWQFSLGDGPCFAAYEHSEAVVADENTLQRRWPALSDQLHQCTRIRSVVTLPLGQDDTRIGALDLYSFTAQPDTHLELPAAQLVAAMIHTSLLTASRMGEPADPVQQGEQAGQGEQGEVAWLNTAPIRRREKVWIAIGMVNATLGVDNPDALALLRARAYANDESLEDLVEDLVAGRVSVQELHQQADT